MNNNIIMPGLEDVKILKVEQMDDRLALFVELRVTFTYMLDMLRNVIIECETAPERSSK